MAEKIKWGIIGTGAIAQTLARAMGPSCTGELSAVASRDKSKAEIFGNGLGLAPARCFGSYEALLADASVQAVYVATPHPQHAKWAIAAAEAGKHVLLEKPSGVNQYDWQAVADAAQQAGVFLMEAFMYRCHPQTAKLVELLRDKTIGDVRVIQATFSFHAGYNPNSRAFSNELAGGGILDVGCYTTSMARLVAGAADGASANPIEVKAVGHLEPTGADGWSSAVLKFPGDIVAQLSTGVSVNQENVVRIFGSKGRITLPNPWAMNRTGPDIGKIIVQINGEPEPKEISVPAEATSFTLELDVFGDAVTAGRTQAEFPAMTWADSAGNVATLDAWRSQIGLIYNFEKPEYFSRHTLADRPLAVRSKNPIPKGKVKHLDKPISRLVMGVDNQTTMPHAAAIFDAYFEAGGNVFDTAFIYGGGMCEKMLGHWVKNRGVRQQVAIIAKGCHTPENFPKVIAKQLTVSLDRLQTDHADLYMMHRDNPDVPVGEWIDALNEQKNAGRIKAFGGSNWALDRVAAANAYAEAHGLQGFSMASNNFSLAHMLHPIWAGCVVSSDDASQTFLKKTQIALFSWSSQARGFFTSRAHRDTSLNDEEMNRCWNDADNWKRRDRAFELAEKKGLAPIVIALAYVLNQPFPTFPLIGPRTIAELRSSLPAVGVTLSPAEVAWLDLKD